MSPAKAPGGSWAPWDPEDDPAVVGLDLSLTATGIAYANGTTRTIVTKDLRDVERLAFIRQEIRMALDVCDLAPDLVVVEGYSFASQYQAANLGELGGVVRMVLADEHEQHPEMAWVVIPPSSLKKYATGSGKADKTAMVVAARERLGWDGMSHDQADATWLRALGLDLLGAPPALLPKTHRAALAGIEPVQGKLP
jgi:Holliday junction resolvasome RuvABC endonuclease subunit